MFSLAVFVSAMLDPRPSRSGAAAGRAHSDDGCDHLSYARARPHTIGSSLFGRWSRRGADLLLQVRCAVYNGTLGSGLGHRFQPHANQNERLANAA